MREQQVLWGQTCCDAAGTVIAGQREDPQRSPGGRREQRSQHCCFSITHLQQVGEISAAVGCYFPGPWVWRPGMVFHPKGDEYLDLGAVAQEQKPICSLISLPSRCPKRSEREAKESFPKGEYVCNLLVFLS